MVSPCTWVTAPSLDAPASRLSGRSSTRALIESSLSARAYFLSSGGRSEPALNETMTVLFLTVLATTARCSRPASSLGNRFDGPAADASDTPAATASIASAARVHERARRPKKVCNIFRNDTLTVFQSDGMTVSDRMAMFNEPSAQAVCLSC